MSTTPGDAKIIYTGPSPRGWHRLQLAAECLQKYAWRYEAPRNQGKETASAPLAKGSLVHLALAQHYARLRAAQTASGTDRVGDWCAPEEAVELIARMEGTTAYVENVLDTYREYVRRFEEEDRKYRVIAVEELLHTNIRGKYLLTGRTDLVLEDLGGRIWVLDHKTGARITSRHKEFYGISGQLIGYSHMARQKYGDRFAGLIVNLIQHAPNPKFDRIVHERSPSLEARFEQIVVDIEESIERLQASGRDFDDWPKAVNELTCYSRYGACEFIDKCRWGYGAKKAGNWSWDER